MDIEEQLEDAFKEMGTKSILSSSPEHISSEKK
jgi:hypothetical protein